MLIQEILNEGPGAYPRKYNMYHPLVEFKVLFTLYQILSNVKIKNHSNCYQTHYKDKDSDHLHTKSTSRKTFSYNLKVLH